MPRSFEDELFAFAKIQEKLELGLELFIASSLFMQKIAASILLSASFSFLSTGFIPVCCRRRRADVPARPTRMIFITP